jgi:K+-transporting ATPase ATPase A chain
MNLDVPLKLGLYLAVLLALAAPLGAYMARVYSGEARVASRVVGPLERLLYRIAGVRADEEMAWTRYAAATLLFNLAGLAVVYVVLRVQHRLPLNPLGFGPVEPGLAFNTAVSFATNTNWQAYGGETTMSFFTQAAALTVQNFVSAASGMAVLAALIRGIARRSAASIGSFWVDLVRSTLYVLLPLSLALAVALAGLGVVQTWRGSAAATTLEPWLGPNGPVAEQTIALGPVASQVAIKQLGTNGGGFYNANSAHPFENPTPVTDFLELLAILLIPAALCFTFGAMVKDRRQGIALLSAMLVVFVPLAFGVMRAEAAPPAGAIAAAGVDGAPSALQAGGNMEGKEARFGPAASALWAAATTAASNGSVDSMHDSYTPLGGLVPTWLILLGEVIFGGVGSGLYGLLMHALIAVFIAGLMVGRTPEYLGKKVEAFEMKMATLVVLLPSAAVLLGAAVASVTKAGTSALGNPGAHGFSELLYAFASASNNNGSAFAGLTATGPFWTFGLGLAMLVGRYWVIVPVLAIAGAMARKRAVPVSAGTLPTHGPLFVTLVVATLVLVGALTFIPALALGPVVEHLSVAAR